jgi:hypothetical protein
VNLSSNRTEWLGALAPLRAEGFLTGCPLVRAVLSGVGVTGSLGPIYTVFFSYGLCSRDSFCVSPSISSSFKKKSSDLSSPRFQKEWSDP